mgnify:FL=1
MPLTPVIETDEITVYGPPESVSLQLDIGPAGPRGNKIFTNIGDPDSYTTLTDGVYYYNSEELMLGDLYYRVDNDSFYTFAQVGTSQEWQLRSGINFYKTVEQVEFTAGVGQVTIPLTDLWVDTGTVDLASSNVCVSLTAVHTDNTFVTITNKTLDSSVPRNLVLDLFGFSMNDATMLPYQLTATVEIDVTISLVL